VNFTPRDVERAIPGLDLARGCFPRP
jgi:hypothetical protein